MVGQSAVWKSKTNNLEKVISVLSITTVSILIKFTEIKLTWEEIVTLIEELSTIWLLTLN